MLRRTVSRSLTTSYPATLAVPELGSARVHRILMVVDLPAPFGPRKPKVSPAATSKLIPRTASISPYFLVSSLTEIAGVPFVCPPPLPLLLPQGYGTAPAACQPRSWLPAGPEPASRPGRPG